MSMALLANLSPLMANPTPNPVDKRTSFNAGQQIFNWASFLNLRAEPHPDATVLALLPFGTVLTVADDQPLSLPFHSELIPDYRPFEDENVLYPGKSVEGNWLHVTYEGFDGYVFDGYLSTLRSYRKKFNEQNWEVLENFISKKYPGSFSEFDPEENIDRIVTQDESAEYRFSQDDYSATHELFLKDVSLDEVLMLCTKLFHIQGIKSISKTEVGLFIENDFNCTLTVNKEDQGSRIVLSFWDGC